MKRIWWAACLCLMGLAASVLGAEGDPPQGPAQPIAFSHRQHAGMLKLPCSGCHTAPEPGEAMTFPLEAKCMSCHATIKTDSPEIQKLAAFAAKTEPVPWVRVYQLPTFVFWSHKTHLTAGADCAMCHGEVGSRDRLSLEKSIKMAACVDCHRNNKAPVHCTFCHEQRN